MCSAGLQARQRGGPERSALHTKKLGTRYSLCDCRFSRGQAAAVCDERRQQPENHRQDRERGHCSRQVDDGRAEHDDDEARGGQGCQAGTDAGQPRDDDTDCSQQLAGTDEANEGDRRLQTAHRFRLLGHLRRRHRQLRTAGEQKHDRQQTLRDPQNGVLLHDQALLAICSRWRVSCALSSSVIAAPRSSSSKIGGISISTPPPKGARLSHSTASSIDFTCQSQKPAMSSFDSVNGPSLTVGAPPENFTRLPYDVGRSPSPASMTPALTSSSLNLPISVRSLVSGRTPASDSLLPGTITMTRIVFTSSF